MNEKTIVVPEFNEPITIVISDDDSDNDNDSLSVIQPVRILKRKINLIPSHFDVENTRKTMKSGPKSKTSNMVTVHQMITEA